MLREPSAPHPLCCRGCSSCQSCTGASGDCLGMRAIIGLVYLQDVTLITCCWCGTRTRCVAAVLVGCWYPMGKSSWHRVPLHGSLWIGWLLRNCNLASLQNVGSFLSLYVSLCFYALEERNRLYVFLLRIHPSPNSHRHFFSFSTNLPQTQSSPSLWAYRIALLSPTQLFLPNCLAVIPDYLPATASAPAALGTQ